MYLPTPTICGHSGTNAPSDGTKFTWTYIKRQFRERPEHDASVYSGEYLSNSVDATQPFMRIGREPKRISFVRVG